MRRSGIMGGWGCIVSLGIAVAAAPPASAGNHPDVTWLPSSGARIDSGRQTVQFRIPQDISGPARQGLLLIGRIEPMPKNEESPPPSAAELAAMPPTEMQVRIKGVALPPWQLSGTWSHYVVNLNSLRASPGYVHGLLLLETDLPGAVVASVSAFGAADLLLARPEQDGPLDAVVAATPAGSAHEYLQAMADHLKGRIDAARAAYERLAAGDDERVARFARRGLRLAAFQQRPRPAEDDYVTARRTLMYLQQVGIFGYARTAGSYVGPDNAGASDAWYRHAELADLFMLPRKDQLQFLQKSGFSSGVLDPAEWHELVLILKSPLAETAGATAASQVATSQPSGAKVAAEQLRQLYDDWQFVERTVMAASRGMMRIRTSYLYLEGAQAQAYMTYPGGVIGPTDDIFSQRGAFDGVMSFRIGGRNVTSGADAGPRGAALSDLSIDCGWQIMLRELTAQFAWGVRACESGPGFPALADLAGCGVRPVPGIEWGCRAALHYYMTPAMWRKTVIGGPARPGTSLRRWRIEGPYEFSPGSATESGAATHLLDPLPPAGAPPAAARTIESDSDWIDLGKLLGRRGGCAARASCWVYVPRDQVVAMWLGFNDGLAAWINGRCVRRGDYVAANRYADGEQPDMVASGAWLQEGWNHVELVIEALPAPADRGFGFSVRFCDYNNVPLIGAAYRTSDPPAAQRVPTWRPPAAGGYFDMAAVWANYHDTTPRLGEVELRKLTGIAGLTLRGAIHKNEGFVGIGVDGGAVGGERSRIRALPTTWNDESDLDWTLNNVLDWAREDTAALSHGDPTSPHTLLLLRPEAVQPYLELLREAAGAAAMFSGKAPSQRILGWVEIPVGAGTRTLLALDACLGQPRDWPVDEEDLLRLPLPPPSTAPSSMPVPDSMEDGGAKP